MTRRTEVSRNGDPSIKEFAILLRAVATTIPATGMLYLAANMLVDDDTYVGDAHNEAILHMVAALLGYAEADLSMVERVLRSLPDPTT